MYLGKHKLEDLVVSLGKCMVVMAEIVAREKKRKLYKGNLKINRKQKNNLLLIEKLIGNKKSGPILWCFCWLDVFVKNKPIYVLTEKNLKIIAVIKKAFKVLLKELLFLDKNITQIIKIILYKRKKTENLELLKILPHAQEAKKTVNFLLNLIFETRNQLNK